MVTEATGWPEATPMDGGRLFLEPLRSDHGDEMWRVLDDPALHEFTGGVPATADELRLRYARLALGRSPDGSEGWLNWIVRRRADDEAVGFVQATLTRSVHGFRAEVAWVIGTPHQHQGFASESSALLVDWLRQHATTSIVAYIHPEHRASEAVARGAGLHPTDHRVDGEILWESRVSLAE